MACCSRHLLIAVFSAISFAAFAATSTAEVLLPGKSAGDQTGQSVAISGTTAVVGAPYANANRSEAGVVYVFIRTNSGWSLQAELRASDGDTGDMFGFAVAIVDNLIVVGAPGDDSSTLSADNGSIYTFTRSGKAWTQRDKESGTSAGDFLGISVSVSGSGTTGTIAAGAFRDDESQTDQGSVSTYTFNGTLSTLQQKILHPSPAASDYFGRSVFISGNTLVVGAYGRDVSAKANQGAAYVYVFGASWTLQATLLSNDGLASDFFGFSVGLSGDVAIVGAYGADIGSNSSQGAAYMYRRSGTTWSQEQKLTDPSGTGGDLFGYAVGVEGDMAAVGAYGVDTGGSLAGAAFKFLFKSPTWLGPQKLQAASPVAGEYLGRAVAVENSGDEELLLAGAPYSDVGATDRGYAALFGPPLVSVSSIDSSALEAGTATGAFRISRTGNTATALTVSYSLTGSTATLTTDYALTGVASGTTVSIPIGSSSVDVTVTPVDDGDPEPMETVKFTVSDGSQYNLGSPTSATVGITDNDGGTAPQSVSISASTPTGSEPSTQGVFTVTRTGGTTGDLTVEFTVGGTATQDVDYSLSATTFTILDGAATATLNVVVDDDTAVELPETVVLTLQPGAGYSVGAPSTATVTVNSDDIGPLVTGVSPAAAPYAPFMLTVSGNTFAANSQIYLNGEALTTNTTQFATGTLSASVNPAQLGAVNVEGFAPNPAGLAGTITVTVRNGTGGNPSNDSVIKIYSGDEIGQWLVATTVDDSKAAQSLRLALEEVQPGDSILFSPTAFALNQSDSATTINIGLAAGELKALETGNVLIDARNRRVNIDGAEGLNGLVLASDSNRVYGLTLVQFENALVIDDGKNNIVGGSRSVGNDGTLSGNGEGLRLSDNSASGILITGSGATGNVVKGCWIGLGPQGLTALPNQNGILIEKGASSNTIGGTGTGEANVISGNKIDGIDINSAGTNGNTIIGNHIGTDKNGTGDLGNGSHGIFLTTGTVGNTVGGSSALGEGNRIAFNKGYGVVVQNTETKQNRVLGNRIYKNVLGGISLENGGNEGLSQPNIDSIVRSGSFSAKLLRETDQVTLVGRSAKPTGTVEVFNDEGAQGGEVLGRATVAEGTWTFSTPTATTTQNFTATFTDADGNTSVFAVFGGSFVDDFDGDGTSNSTDLDDDGDGYSDIFEVAAGTDPFSSASSPGIVGGAATPDLNILKAAVKLNFAKAANDALSLSGVMPLADGTNPKGLPVVVEVGGVVFQQFTSGGKEFKLTKPKNNSTKYSLKLSKQSVAASFADDGLTDATLKNAPASLTVLLAVNGVGYRGTVALTYTAKQGKTGSAKK